MRDDMDTILRRLGQNLQASLDGVQVNNRQDNEATMQLVQRRLDAFQDEQTLRNQALIQDHIGTVDSNKGEVLR